MGDFHGYDTSDDYFIKAVWPLASRELRLLSKTRDFSARGPGRVMRGKEVAKELEGRMVEAILDVPHPKRGGTDPLVVRVTGSHMTPDDGEYSIHMDSPFFHGTHGYHAPMTGDPQADAKGVAADIADMVDDMRSARPGLEEGLVPKGPATTAARVASRLVWASRKVHLKVVLHVFAVADDEEGFDLAAAVREAVENAGIGGAEGLDVQDVSVESVEVTDSR
jgi:hypothetical protein